MDLKKFNEARPINEEIVSINSQIEKWQEAKEFYKLGITLSTKTGATIETNLKDKLFQEIKELHINFLKNKLKELQTKFNAI